jgi:hypothetical protein
MSVNVGASQWVKSLRQIQSILSLNHTKFAFIPRYIRATELPKMDEIRWH